ncbi:MAG: low-specificity L-threonine aldolase [Sporomusaceae bacterium]|nr:low-specificity L-threonine aldolase [Sporomusaceae bacterium]
MRIVDLRSDTVTLPTPAMRQAMQVAEVGDDVYREDPTILELEELAARITGKEAALFVASGTMGNQIAVMTHTQKGDEVICEAGAHIYWSEAGGLATLAGVQPRPITAVRGILTAADLAAAIRSQDLHQPGTSLICLENSHNRAGGTCYPLAVLTDIHTLARNRQIAVHMDGARLFNAAAAQGVSAGAIAACADSIQFCLSKGLCAPVGSLLAGKREFIERARRYRKMLGGGMRQAGILAAAGIIALTQMVDRLAEDHENAAYLADSLANCGFGIDLTTVQTNIVIFDVAPLGLAIEQLLADLAANGVKAVRFGPTRARMVTHYGISREDIDYVAAVAARLVK